LGKIARINGAIFYAVEILARLLLCLQARVDVGATTWHQIPLRGSGPLASVARARTSAPWSWQEIHHRVAGEERQDQLGSVREHRVYAPFAPQGMQDERAGRSF
jgi:hypothetical protein